MLPLTLKRHAEEPLNLMEREFNRIFRNMWDGQALPDSAAYPVDIREDDQALIIEAELPGFKREEVDVSIDHDVLSIVAERKPAEKKGTEHLTERRYLRVERSFTLPCAVDESKVEAKLDQGVLYLRLPKTEASKPHKITLK